MGPYLTTPKKEKEVQNGENAKVSSLVNSNLISLNSVLAACKDGVIPWRTRTLQL
jgi:hypothetical protein